MQFAGVVCLCSKRPHADLTAQKASHAQLAKHNCPTYSSCLTSRSEHHKVFLCLVNYVEDRWSATWSNLKHSLIPFHPAIAARAATLMHSHMLSRPLLRPFWAETKQSKPKSLQNIIPSWLSPSRHSGLLLYFSKVKLGESAPVDIRECLVCQQYVYIDWAPHHTHTRSRHITYQTMLCGVKARHVPGHIWTPSQLLAHVSWDPIREGLTVTVLIVLDQAYNRALRFSGHLNCDPLHHHAAEWHPTSWMITGRPANVQPIHSHHQTLVGLLWESRLHTPKICKIHDMSLVSTCALVFVCWARMLLLVSPRAHYMSLYNIIIV